MKIVRYTFIIAVLLGLVIFVFIRLKKPVAGFSEGEKAPSFSLKNTAGNVKRLNDYKGNLILVHFWASWCHVCRHEAPFLEAMYKKLKKDGLVVVSISIDRSRGPVEAFIKKYAVTFPVLLDPNQDAASVYGITGVPETYILDRNYRLIRHVIGPLDWTSNKVIKYLSTLIKKKV